MDATLRVRCVLSASVLLMAAACADNPITGERELSLVSLERQIAIGEQQYRPAQQMQGGRYLVDAALGDYVRRVGERVAAASAVDLPYEFVVLNNSVPNAWALPGGKVAVNRGLLTKLGSEAELAAVLGHEIAHTAGRHGARAIERGLVSQAVLIGMAAGAADSEYAATALGVARAAAGLLGLKYGRDDEREADHYGTRFVARAGYDPAAAAKLQESFLRLSEGREPSWLAGLLSSHPASAERLENMRALVEELRAEGFTGGDIGVEEYQAQLQPLRRDAEAYAAYDQARAALADGDHQTAEARVETALALRDREAAFHGLRGDLRLAQQRYRDAEINYDRAIARNEGYFAYYLGRGAARSRLAEADGADEDLRRSLALLPSAAGYAELGRLAEAAGDIEAALRHYLTAAQSKSVAGEGARRHVLRLDVPRNPGRYLETRLSRDASGRLVLQVTNPTPAPLTGVVVAVETRLRAGGSETYRPSVGTIAPGASRLLLVTDVAIDIIDARAAAVAARVAD